MIIRPTQFRWVVVALAFSTATANAGPPTAADLALRMLDGEALYTVTGGLKPVSDGYWQAQFPADQETSPDVDEARRILAALPLGPDLEAGVNVFAKAFQGKKTASAFVVHKPSLRALIARRPDAFGPLGIDSGTSPQTVMDRIDRGPAAARWRAYGLAFGYPPYAVEFFVAAGEEENRTKVFVPRDFIHIPTFESDRGRFVYAVPKGHTERPEDVYLKAATAPILTRYRAWRQVYMDDPKLGSIELMRYWVNPPGAGSNPLTERFVTCHSVPVHRTFMFCKPIRKR